MYQINFFSNWISAGHLPPVLETMSQIIYATFPCPVNLSSPLAAQSWWTAVWPSESCWASASVSLCLCLSLLVGSSWWKMSIFSWQGHGPVQPGIDHLKVLDKLLIGQTCLVRIELPAIRALEAACGGLNSRVPARVSSTVGVGFGWRGWHYHNLEMFRTWV